MARKILIADGDPIFVENITNYLTTLGGYSIITALDSMEAISIARRENPALVLIDENLSPINGFKFSRLIKFDKRRSHIPIIILADTTDEENQKLAKEVGAEEYIIRAEKERLVSRIKEIVS